MDPDNRDCGSVTKMKLTSTFISSYFKGVATTPSIVEPCMYTVSDWKQHYMDKAEHVFISSPPPICVICLNNI